MKAEDLPSPQHLDEDEIENVAREWDSELHVTHLKGYQCVDNLAPVDITLPPFENESNLPIDAVALILKPSRVNKGSMGDGASPQSGNNAVTQVGGQGKRWTAALSELSSTSDPSLTFHLPSIRPSPQTAQTCATADGVAEARQEGGHGRDHRLGSGARGDIADGGWLRWPAPRDARR